MIVSTMLTKKQLYFVFFLFHSRLFLDKYKEIGTVKDHFVKFNVTEN